MSNELKNKLKEYNPQFVKECDDRNSAMYQRSAGMKAENNEMIEEINKLKKENKELRERLVKYEQQVLKGLNKIGVNT